MDRSKKFPGESPTRQKTHRRFFKTGLPPHRCIHKWMINERTSPAVKIQLLTNSLQPSSHAVYYNFTFGGLMLICQTLCGLTLICPALCWLTLICPTLCVLRLICPTLSAAQGGRPQRSVVPYLKQPMTETWHVASTACVKDEWTATVQTAAGQEDCCWMDINKLVWVVAAWK